MLELPYFEDDGLFIYAPSFLIAEELEESGRLLEGKALGTARKSDLVLLQNIMDKPDTKEYANERKKGQTVGKRALKRVQKRINTELYNAIIAYQEDEIDEKQLRKRVQPMMREAWADAFMAGLRAGGVTGEGKGKKGVPNLTDVDKAWLKGASKHEMTFLNKFLKAVIDGTTRMPIAQRVGMYADAASSFYETARVIGLPVNTIIHWSGPNDDRTCPGCDYMFTNTPFTKMTLPTTPRSGMTPCLTNCRDRLFIRRGTEEEVKRVEAGQKYTRGGHIKNLRRIKREAHGG